MKVKILLVDDEKQGNAFLAENLLFELEELNADWDLEVNTADSGEDAIDLIRSGAGDYNLVLSDYLMPGMNGIDLFGILKKDYPVIKRVLMTGHLEKEMEPYLDQGLVEHLINKPLSDNRFSEISDLIKQ